MKITPQNESRIEGRTITMKKPRGRFANDTEALSFLNEKASFTGRVRDPAHLTLQRQWFLNICYFAGITFDSYEDFRDVDPFLIPTSGAFRANFIQRFVRYMVAQLTSGDPQMSVIPKGTEPEDIFGAQVAENMLAYYERMLDIPGMLQEEAYWLTVTGNCFKYCDWEARAGRKLEMYLNPFSNEPELADDLDEESKAVLKKIGKKKVRREGAMQACVFSPFQFLKPSSGRKLKELPWIMLVYEQSLDWIAERYGKKWKEVTPEQRGYDDFLQYWDRLQTLVGRTGLTVPADGFFDEDSVKIREMWYPPSPRHPKGHWIRATHNTVLAHGPHPYADAGVDLEAEPFMRFPVTHSGFFPVPGRFWYSSMVEHLLSPQADYNIGVRQSIQMRDRLATPMWLMPSHMQLIPERNAIGDIAKYDGVIHGGAPQLMQAPNVSSMHVDARVRAYEEMQTIASQGEATQGQTPQGLRSGIALRSLQEKENMTLSPTIKLMESAHEDFCKRMLRITHLFMDIPKMVQIYGETNMGEVMIFQGSDLNGNCQVEIARGSMRPKSEAETVELMMELLQSGLVNPQNPEELEMVYNALPIRGADALFTLRNQHKRNALKENDAFMRPNLDETGQLAGLPEVEDFDDHAMHIEVHMQLITSDFFKYRMNPMEKQMVRSHVMVHQQQLAQIMQAMATQQAAMQGGGPQQQGGSPPSPKGQPSPPRKRQPTPGTDVGAA